MDINMPFLDGNKASIILKEKMKKGEMKSIPIIVNSANHIESRDKPAHFDDVLNKPIKRDELYRKVGYWVKKKPS